MNARDLAALKLLAQIQRLTAAGDETAARLTIRNAAGEWIGDVPLSARAVEALTDGTMSVCDHAEIPAAAEFYGFHTTADLDTTHALAAEVTAGAEPGTILDPVLVADIEDHFDSISPESYMDDVIAADSPEAAMAAFDQLVTGEWDGQL